MQPVNIGIAQISPTRYSIADDGGASLPDVVGNESPTESRQMAESAAHLRTRWYTEQGRAVNPWTVPA